MLDVCLDAGITEWNYWNMTYGEIVNAIKSHNRNLERDQKEKAALTYKMADLISTGVASLFDKEVKFPRIYDVFPGLFEKEKMLVEKMEAEKQSEIYREKFAAFAQSHNARWGEINK